MATAIVSMGCGTVKPRLTYSGYGAADPARDDAVVEAFGTSPADSTELDPEIAVLVDTVPEGLDVSDNSIEVESGYRHRLIGKFVVVPGKGHGFTGTITFADYEKTWRKGMCYPQVVLSWLTLMVWTLVPTSYPCHGDGAFDRQRAIEFAKRVAAEAGGDLVLISYLGHPRGRKKTIGGVAGIVLEADPRLQQGTLDTRPGQLSPQTNMTRIPDLDAPTRL